VSTSEDTAVTTANVLTNDTDLDGDTITVSDFAQPEHGTIVYNGDGTFTYTPNANYHGNDAFTYTITDGNGETATATVSVTVSPVDDPTPEPDDFGTGDTNGDAPPDPDANANQPQADGGGSADPLAGESDALPPRQPQNGPHRSPSREPADDLWDGTEDLRVLNPLDDVAGTVQRVTSRQELPSLRPTWDEPRITHTRPGEIEFAKGMDLLDLFFPRSTHQEGDLPDTTGRSFHDLYEEAERHERRQDFADPAGDHPDAGHRRPDDAAPPPTQEHEHAAPEPTGAFAKIWALFRATGGITKSSAPHAATTGREKGR
ncbi:MAG: tandem-95 repeat protein, partial [Phycisphaerae bacterium]|nr:tandem-95 repeat protein [Phycisphaerae bacterium]